MAATYFAATRIHHCRQSITNVQRNLRTFGPILIEYKRKKKKKKTERASCETESGECAPILEPSKKHDPAQS